MKPPTPFIVLLQNKHTTLAENGENLISAQPRMSPPRISAHSQGPNNLISTQGGQSNKYGINILM